MQHRPRRGLWECSHAQDFRRIPSISGQGPRRSGRRGHLCLVDLRTGRSADKGRGPTGINPALARQGPRTDRARCPLPSRCSGEGRRLGLANRAGALVSGAQGPDPGANRRLRAPGGRARHPLCAAFPARWRTIDTNHGSRKRSSVSNNFNGTRARKSRSTTHGTAGPAMVRRSARTSPTRR